MYKEPNVRKVGHIEVPAGFIDCLIEIDGMEKIEEEIESAMLYTQPIFVPDLREDLTLIMGRGRDWHKDDIEHCFLWLVQTGGMNVLADFSSPHPKKVEQEKGDIIYFQPIYKHSLSYPDENNLWMALALDFEQQFCPESHDTFSFTSMKAKALELFQACTQNFSKGTDWLGL